MDFESFLSGAKCNRFWINLVRGLWKEIWSSWRCEEYRVWGGEILMEIFKENNFWRTTEAFSDLIEFDSDKA